MGQKKKKNLWDKLLKANTYIEVKIASSFHSNVLLFN